MSQSNFSLLDFNNENSTAPLIICPNCKIKIPNLRLNDSDNQINVTINCPCRNEKKTMSLEKFINELKDNKFDDDISNISDCNLNYDIVEINNSKFSQWTGIDKINNDKLILNEHTLISQFQCKKHKTAFVYYCSNCKVNLCNDCSFDHQNNNHEVIPLQVIQIKEEHLDIDNAMGNNKQLYLKLIERINKEITMLNQMMKDITNIYSLNEKININLKTLYQSLYETSILFKNYPTFELIALQQSIRVNNTNYIEEDLSLEEEYKIIKEYLQGNHVLKWNATNKCVLTLTDHSELIRSVIELKDKRLASCSSDLYVKLWDLTNRECIATLKGHTNVVYCIVQLNNSMLASGSWDKTIKIWDITSLKCSKTLIGHTNEIYCLILLQNGNLASGSSDSTIKIWDKNNYQCIITITTSVNKGIIFCLVELDNNVYVYNGQDNAIKLWGRRKYEEESFPKEHYLSIYCLLKLFDGRLASGSKDMTIKIWKINTNECLASLTGHSAAVKRLLQLRDNRLASGSLDNTIRFWNITRYECINIIQAHSNNVLGLIQLNDGRLASSSGDKTIKIWDI